MIITRRILFLISIGVLSACGEAAATTGDGGQGTTSTGGAGGELGGMGGDGGTTTTTSSTTTTTAPPTCTDLICADVDCGQVLFDCDGDGKQENHLCPDKCQAPAACGGDYTLNECGTKCQVKPEYLEACGFGVEFACDVECGYCYQYYDGEPVYQVMGFDCPVVETTGDPGPMAVRCCKGGCCQ